MAQSTWTGFAEVHEQHATYGNASWFMWSCTWCAAQSRRRWTDRPKAEAAATAHNRTFHEVAR